MTHTITLIPGDGIGPDITEATIRVLDAVGADLVWDRQMAGASAAARYNDPIPEATLDSIKKNRVALKGPLEYDTVEPQKFDKWEKPLFRKELRDRSGVRIAADPEFGYITQDLERSKQRIAENRMSLNIDKRKAEMDEDKARKEKRTAERAKLKPADEKRYAVTLDNASKPDLQLVKNEKKGVAEKGQTPASKDATAEVPAKAADPDAEDADEEVEGGKQEVDAVRGETINVLTDLIELSRGGKATTTATAAK